MREILFRGKEVESSDWYYGDIFHSSMNVDTTRIHDYINRANVEIIPDTLGQYTGLTDKNGTKIFEGDIVKFKHGGEFDKKIYYRNYAVTLKNESGIRSLKVHRLVATAFISNPKNKPFVNHINGIKDDNRVDNLEWSTAKENNYHAWNVLDSSNRRKVMAEHSHNREWTEESRAKMSAINKGRKHSDVSRQHMSEAHIGKSNNCRKRKVICVETGIIYGSATDASKILNCSRSQICNALKNSILTAGGFHWERCE